MSKQVNWYDKPKNFNKLVEIASEIVKLLHLTPIAGFFLWDKARHGL